VQNALGEESESSMVVRDNGEELRIICHDPIHVCLEERTCIDKSPERLSTETETETEMETHDNFIGSDKRAVIQWD